MTRTIRTDWAIVSFMGDHKARRVRRFARLIAPLRQIASRFVWGLSVGLAGASWLLLPFLIWIGF